MPYMKVSYLAIGNKVSARTIIIIIHVLYVVGFHGLFIDHAFKIVTDKNSVGPDNLNEKKIVHAYVK